MSKLGVVIWLILGFCLNNCPVLKAQSSDAGSIEVDQNDDQIKFIAKQASVEFNKNCYENSNDAKYIHTLNVTNASIDLQSGIVWYISISVVQTNCSLADINFDYATLETLADECVNDNLLGKS